MRQTLKAFTMAEAILVMTILGIIATIMISTLKPAEFKEKALQTMAKKVLSEIDVATTQILMNNTTDGTLDTLIEAGTSNIIQFYRGGSSDKFLNLYKKYLTTLRVTPGSNLTQFSDDNASVLLKDGASIGISFSPWGEMPTIFPGETNITYIECDYGYIWFDTNDNEPPNVFGKDQFVLPFDKNGIKYAQ